MEEPISQKLGITFTTNMYNANIKDQIELNGPMNTFNELYMINMRNLLQLDYH